MKYTLSDIRIKGLPKYEENGLDISFTVEGKTSTQLLSLTNSSLIDSLIESRNILDGDTEDNIVIKSFNHSWIGLDLYMENNLSVQLAEDLVLNYLNNKTEKP